MEAQYEMIPSKNDPQGQGSVITYMRRYALGAVLGLNIDVDDDANTASGLTGSKASNVVRKASNAEVDDILKSNGF